MTSYADGMGTYSMTVQGEARTYMVYVPAGRTSYSAIYFFLHGMGGTANRMCTVQIDVTTGADAHDYIAVCPQAAQDLQGRNAWHAFPGGSFYGPSYRYDYAEFAAHSDKDLEFFETLIDTVNASKPVPKVFMMGYSRGASMAYHFHCARAHRLDGLVAIANQWYDPYKGWGWFGDWPEHTSYGGRAGPTPDEATTCQPTKAIPVWMATGAQDGFYRGWQRSSWDIYSKRAMGCTGEPFTAWSSPQATLEQGQGIRCLQHSGCTNTERTRYCEYEQLGHSPKPWQHSNYALTAEADGWAFLNEAVQSPHPPQPPPMSNPPPWTMPGAPMMPPSPQPPSPSPPASPDGNVGVVIGAAAGGALTLVGAGLAVYYAFLRPPSLVPKPVRVPVTAKWFEL